VSVKDIPAYIVARIRQRSPAGAPVVAGSTPVVAFGDVRKAAVATLGWNPSKREFLDSRGNELVRNERRLETLASLGESDLATASPQAVARVFDGCANYFHIRPYSWFNSLEKVLTSLGASYYDGSACHLDLVQSATDPVWGEVPRPYQDRLLDADLPFLRQQLAHEQFCTLLLNGAGIMKAYEERLRKPLTEATALRSGRVRFFTGRNERGLKVVGWNINLQSSFGVSGEEIQRIAAAARSASR
jgi:hypothetical protein